MEILGPDFVSENKASFIEVYQMSLQNRREVTAGSDDGVRFIMNNIMALDS